ncbi:MAG: MerR family transcriptional regulator [Magnetococcus sp. YQC-3]
MFIITPMPNSTCQTFTLDELCTLTDMPRRTIRFYIQKGLLSGPSSVGRGASYTQGQLETLLTIRKWKQAGLTLERIAELLTGSQSEIPPLSRPPGSVEVWSHVVIDAGIELHINPEHSELPPEKVRQLIALILDGYKTIQGDTET